MQLRCYLTRILVCLGENLPNVFAHALQFTILRSNKERTLYFSNFYVVTVFTLKRTDMLIRAGVHFWHTRQNSYLIWGERNTYTWGRVHARQ